MSFESFLDAKTIDGTFSGFDPVSLPSGMFDFQREATSWAIRKGKAAIFADCGLGKTLMQLAFAQNCVEHSNRAALVLTPLAVASQTLDEAKKFGIAATISPTVSAAAVHITNYEKLHHYSADDFSAVILDESSILKSFNGQRRAEITRFMSKVPYRLLCTATAAPNDYIELGTSSEALGELGHLDMLARFFKNDQNNFTSKDRFCGKGMNWRFKGHAELPFWRWVCSWARALRKPSDLGFSDEGFSLPPLIEREHVVKARTLAPGMLFDCPARDLKEEREERRRTIQERCEIAAELATHNDAAVVWCHLNDESALLAKVIPGAAEISGSTPDEKKEAIYRGFSDGSIRCLITKPKIGAWGLNWQHCNHVVTFASHSYEQYYQSVRRCWRFGQKRAVTVDLVASEGEHGIKENLQRKAKQAEKMFARLVESMNNAQRVERSKYAPHKTEIPTWL